MKKGPERNHSSNFDATANLLTCRQLTDVRVPLPEGSRPRTVLLRFGATRSRIVQVAFGGQVATGHSEQQREFAFQIPETTKDADLATAHVQWTGDPPVLIDAKADAATETRAPASDLAAVYSRREARIREIEREEALQPPPAPKAPLMRFFYELDVATNPDLLSAPEQRRMLALTRLFRVRLKDRGRAKVTGRRFVEEMPFSRGTHETALAAGQTVGGLVVNAFGTLEDASSQQRFDHCFERFVCGELSLRDSFGDPNPLQSHGAPNGINYLLFAEFALYLITLHPEPGQREFWGRALPTFVRTVEVFLDLYWSGACRTFSSYGFEWRGERVFSIDRRERLRRSYRECTRAGTPALAERFNLLCAFALRDDIGDEVHNPREMP